MCCCFLCFLHKPHVAADYHTDDYYAHHELHPKSHHHSSKTNISMLLLSNAIQIEILT